MNWWNELHEEEGWFVEHETSSNCCKTEHGKIEPYEAKNFDKGCRICGTITGEHGFSFDKKKDE